MDARVNNAMSLREAAQLLDVTEKQVQYLARHARIAALCPRDSRREVRQGLPGPSAGRAYTRMVRSNRVAIALISKYDKNWIGQAQGSRLRGRLANMNAEQLVAAARNRALIGHSTGHPAVVARLHADGRTGAQRSLPWLTMGSPW